MYSMLYQADYLYDPKSQDWLLTVSEAARRLRVSQRTLYRMLRCGELRRIKVRGCTRVLGSEVAYLLSSTEYDDADLVGRPIGDPLPIEAELASDEGVEIDVAR
jgi:excisionase family DNA binding protein